MRRRPKSNFFHSRSFQVSLKKLTRIERTIAVDARLPKIEPIHTKVQHDLNTKLKRISQNWKEITYKRELRPETTLLLGSRKNQQNKDG